MAVKAGKLEVIVIVRGNESERGKENVVMLRRYPKVQLLLNRVNFKGVARSKVASQAYLLNWYLVKVV